MNVRSILEDFVVAASTLSKGERTRQAILDAAEQLILRQGYHGTSMRQIARQANIAVGGIYNHFANKEAIFAALLERHQPYTDIAAGLASLSEDNVVDLVQRAACLMIDEIMADPIFIRLGFIDLQEFGGDTILQHAIQMVRGLLAFVESLVSSGQIRGDVPLPVVARSFAGLVVFFVLSETVVFDDDPSRAGPSFAAEFGDINWIEGIVDVFLRGVLKREEL